MSSRDPATMTAEERADGMRRRPLWNSPIRETS
jgi:hypothetical protein